MIIKDYCLILVMRETIECISLFLEKDLVEKDSSFILLKLKYS